MQPSPYAGVGPRLGEQGGVPASTLDTAGAASGAKTTGPHTQWQTREADTTPPPNSIGSPQAATAAPPEWKEPPQDFVKQANLSSVAEYEALYKQVRRAPATGPAPARG